MKEAKQIIVVRKDLGMRKGKIAAQACHASLGAVLKLIPKQQTSKGLVLSETTLKKDTPEYTWLDGPFTKICVSCDSLEELLEIKKAADNKRINTCLITDAGKTEFHGIPTITCCAIGPGWSDDIDQVCGHLKLL